MQKKVFISFSSKDAKIAQSICTALEVRGHRCWTSGRDVTPGENYQGAIVRAIVVVETDFAHGALEMSRLAGARGIVVVRHCVAVVRRRERHGG